MDSWFTYGILNKNFHELFYDNHLWNYTKQWHFLPNTKYRTGYYLHGMQMPSFTGEPISIPLGESFLLCCVVMI